MKHITTQLMQKVKKHFTDRKVSKFNKTKHDEFHDEDLYTGAVGSADLQRLKYIDESEVKVKN